MADTPKKISDKTPLPGDWTVATQKKAPPPVSMDDVVHGFRWILGREPAKIENITSHIKIAKGNRHALRMHFLTCPEFSRQLSRLNIIPQNEKSSVAVLPPHDASIDNHPIIFVHIPKTGGTSLHYHLSTCFTQDEICEFRHNDILMAPVHKIIGKRFYSGHFDSRLMGIMPSKAKLVTVLRNPKDRLVSVYRYMRATKEERIATEGQPLARLARDNNFEPFLEKAYSLNPAAVDNIYCRSFGSALPLDRWERAADVDWAAVYGDLSDHAYKAMFERASSLLGAKTTIVIDLANMNQAIISFFQQQNLPIPNDIEHLKRTDDITSDAASFEPVEMFEPGNSDILTKLIKWDVALYEKFTN